MAAPPQLHTNVQSLDDVRRSLGQLQVWLNQQPAIERGRLAVGPFPDDEALIFDVDRLTTLALFDLRNVSTGSTATVLIPDGTTDLSLLLAKASAEDMTLGSVLFAGADGAVTQDNANLFWDDTHKRLGVGVNTSFDESTGLDVAGNIDLIHTATEADDHAIELDVDAAGFGDVKAIDIDYISGAIADGQDEAVILLNIDELAATGGDIFGLEVLATEGSATIWAVKAAALVGPIHQDSGVFINPTTGTNNTDSTDVPDMIDGDIGTPTAIFQNDDEFIIIGAAAAFEELELVFTTTANVSIKPTFFYSTSGTGQFTQFTPVDGTNGCRNNGVVAWDASDLTGHVADDVTGTFDIKIIRTRNNLNTSPILGYAKTAATTEYLWDKDGKMTIGDIDVANDLVVAGEIQGSRVVLTGAHAAGLGAAGNVYLYAQNGVQTSATIGFRAPRAGSIVSVSFQATFGTVVHSGSVNATMRVTVNGSLDFFAALGVSTSNDNQDTGTQSTQARGADTFSAGDILALNFRLFPTWSGPVTNIVGGMGLVFDT